MESPTILYLIAAAVFSGLISFAMTPPVRALAKRIGAIDIPNDSRRMHTVPIPRLGGLAVFLGFMLASWLFATVDKTLLAVWLGGLIIVAMGVIDDVFRLHPIIKLLIQIAAALTVYAQGLTIEFLHIGNYYIIFDSRMTIVVTLLWIVGLTNAMNLIDGLDGLSGGIAAIASLSLTVLSFLRGDTASALLTAILFGACVGFLPFNRYPAKIFLGDTGSQFLGFLLAVLTLSGLFKTHAVISFFAPVVIFALPLFDTTFAFFRRLFTGKNPFKGDRGHLHHRLMDLGYTQKETVSVLHAICGILGISAVLFSLDVGRKAIYALASGAVVLFLYLCLLHPTKAERAALKKGAAPAPTPASAPAPAPTPVAAPIPAPIESTEAEPEVSKQEPQALPAEPDDAPIAFETSVYDEAPLEPEPEVRPEPISFEGADESAPEPTRIEPVVEDEAAVVREVEQPQEEANEEPIGDENEGWTEEEPTPTDEEESQLLAQLERLFANREASAESETESVIGPVILSEPEPQPSEAVAEAPASEEPEVESLPIVHPHRLQSEEDPADEEHRETFADAAPAESYLSFDGSEEQVPHRRRPRPSRTLPGGKK